MDRPDEPTEAERDLISKHRRFYEQLDFGNRQATTDAQRHFVAVCRGEVQPDTAHECAYTKYKKYQAWLHTPFSHDPNFGLPSRHVHGEWDEYDFQKCK